MRSNASIGGGSARLRTGLIGQSVLIAAVSGGLLWLVWVYGSALRDARYLDGWILAGGMGLQLYFHIAIKSARLSPRSAARWRKVHVFVGFILIAAFLSHSDFSLPDTGFEWALWAGFVLVTASGIFGTYLAWSLKTKRRIDDSVTYEGIPRLRSDLAHEAFGAVTSTDPAASSIALPGLPYDGWIMDLYTNHLRDFFQEPRNFAAHLIASERPVKRLIDEIDGLSRYVDQQSQDKLAVIKSLVLEKDRLDFARVHLGLGRAWQFVHVPVTYGLIVLAVLHVIVAYAFSAGAW